MDTELDQHPRAQDLSFPLPDGWVLQQKEDYGDEVWFCQHPESMRTTDTHDSAETAAQYAHLKHKEHIDADHTLPWEEQAAEPVAEDVEQVAETDGAMVMGEPDDDQAQPVEVLDEDEGEYVTVTPEMRAEAQHAVSQIQAGVLVTAYWIARVYDEGLYSALGCNTKQAFADRYLPFGHRQAQKYAKIGRRIGGFLPSGPATNGEPDQLPAGDLDEGDVPESVAGLDMGKLQALTELDDDDLRDYVETGQWTGPDGETYTREDVMEMARADLEDVVQERTEKLRQAVEEEKEKRQTYEELAEKRKEEKEALQEELDEKADKIEAAEDLERRLGPTASKLEEKRKTLDQCADHLDEAIRLAGQIGLTTDDPQADQENLLRLLQRAQRLQDVLREDYAQVFIELGI